jgi:pentatricopeptide repeat domain-containing protein 1
MNKGRPTNFDSGYQYDDPDDVISVEALIDQISQIPKGQKIGHEIFSLMKAMDSRSGASLLKELARIGLVGRAVEIFDHIRFLNDNDPLAQSMQDVYSYTAAISLCINSHDVDRALTLAAEMKARKIQCNVHTYTALMNVCIKCSRYGKALETYNIMRAEGCTPNVVTFNTLIDVYGKTGAWEQAIGVLDIMRREGVHPVLRTYNTLLIACNMCNQPREAIAAYTRMLDEGFTPNSTTYNALISAYGKSGQLEKVMEVYQEMTMRGCEKNVITYSSLISACEKAGQWELALELFQEMARERCSPNTVTYNSLITALGQGGQWEKAQAIFDQMDSRKCTPDVVTYTALISAMEKGGQWRLALSAYEQMRKQGCKADAIVYNAVVNALWETGIVWAQRVALRLFKVAISEGHFPQQSLIPGLVRAEVNLHATTSGIAMLSLYVWFLKFQEFVKKYGPDAAPSKIIIVTDRGRGSREQGNLVVKEAVTAIMNKWSSPFSLSTQNNHTTNPTLEAPGSELALWVVSTKFDEHVFSFFPCSDRVPRDPENVYTDDDIMAMLDDPGHQKEASVEERCTAAFAAVKHFEKMHCLVVQNMGYNYLQRRKHLVQSCLAINTKLGGPEESAHDAVLLMDRVMSTTLNFSSEVFDLLASACVMLAYDQLDNASPIVSTDDDKLEKATGLPAWALKQMEWSIRQALGQDVASISTIRCVKLMMERLGAQHLKPRVAEAISGDSVALCTECMSDTAFLNCRPSIVAAAVVYADRRSRGAIPFWPSALAKLTGYNDVSALELSVAIKTAQRICSTKGLENVLGSGIHEVRSNSLSGRNNNVPNMSSLDSICQSPDKQSMASLEREYSLPVANISDSAQAILQSLQERAAALHGAPITPSETDESLTNHTSSSNPSSGDQSTHAPSSNNENSSSSGHSSEDGASNAPNVDRESSLWSAI